MFYYSLGYNVLKNFLEFIGEMVHIYAPWKQVINLPMRSGVMWRSPMTMKKVECRFFAMERYVFLFAGYFRFSYVRVIIM